MFMYGMDKMVAPLGGSGIGWVWGSFFVTDHEITKEPQWESANPENIVTKKAVCNEITTHPLGTA